MSAADAAQSQAEAYRVLRSNLSVALADLEHPIVLVTSARAGEGKTSTAVNLARSMGLSGHRVVLVDFDLRHPDVHNWLEVPNEVGVSDVLLDRLPLEDCLQYVEIGVGPTLAPRAIYVLPTGSPVADPTELLSSRRTAQLLDTLVREADVVLVDTPPILPIADTLVIGRMSAGALLVVEMRRTPVGAVQQAKNALIRNQTRLLGVVVNKLQSADITYGYGYGYGYGSGYPDREDEPEAV